jgi:hypothetical protein
MQNKDIVHFKIDDIEGYLNVETEEVFVYHLKYKNIYDALKNVHHDLFSHRQEVLIMNDLINKLQL